MYGLLLLANVANACSRVLYGMKDDVGFMTGRTMDWYDDPETKMYAFPPGLDRDGGLGEGSIEWTSLYGSVVSSIYGVATAEGMNTEGLGVHLLYLSESDHGNDWREVAGEEKMSVGAWVQYLLDNFANVADAVTWQEQDIINIIAPPVKGGVPSAVHLSLSDNTGDSAVFEYIGGYLVVHHGPEYTVMTNSPTFEKQLAIKTYWEEIGGLSFLPGTHRAADRFVRLAWNAAAVPKVADERLAEATTMSLIRHMSVPIGISDPDKPNIATTFWRTVVNHKSKIYYFEPIDRVSVFWVKIENLNLDAPGAETKMLEIHGKQLSNEVSHLFVPASPFAFLKPGDFEGEGEGHESKKAGCLMDKTAAKYTKPLDKSTQQSAENCNTKCTSVSGAELFTYSVNQKSCICLQARGATKIEFVTVKSKKVTAFLMGSFSDTLCK